MDRRSPIDAAEPAPVLELEAPFALALLDAVELPPSAVADPPVAMFWMLTVALAAADAAWLIEAPAEPDIPLAAILPKALPRLAILLAIA
jgi:hypothetical protein